MESLLAKTSFILKMRPMPFPRKRFFINKLLMENIFSCIPLSEQFSEFNEKLLQSRQEKFNEFAPLFVKWSVHIPMYNKVCPIINAAFKRCRGYLDDVFLKRFPTKEEFWSRLWELFLCDFLITRNFILDSNKKKEWTPDFCVVHNGIKIWIEASMPAEHVSIGKVWNWTYKLDDISHPRYLRLSDSFWKKSSHWNSTYINNWCQQNEPFIIAINWNSIDSWISDKWMLWVLYWIGLTQIDKHGRVSYQRLKPLSKENGTSIDMGYFIGHEHAHVSWVIYLESEIMIKNDDLLVENRELQFIPNINAKNPLGKDFIKQLGLYSPIDFE